MFALRNTMRLLRSIPSSSYCVSLVKRAEVSATSIPIPLHSKRSFINWRNYAAGVVFREINDSFSAPKWMNNTYRSFHSSRCQSQAYDDTNQSTKIRGNLREQSYHNIDIKLIENRTVCLIYLHRPEAFNCLSESLMFEVIDACQIFDNMEEVGAIIITGTGKTFATGAYVKEMKDKSFHDVYKSRPFSNWNAISAVRKPIIAAVNGFALGGGCELAMACDIVLAGEKAVFGQPEVKLGTIPGMGGTQRLIREVGKSRAMEMILTGKAFMNAEEAAKKGLVSRVISGDNEALVAEAIQVAKNIAALSRPTIAMAKEAVNTGYELGLSEGIKSEHFIFSSTFALEDRSEGMTASAEERDPQFRHK